MYNLHLTQYCCNLNQYFTKSNVSHSHPTRCSSSVMFAIPFMKSTNLQQSFLYQGVKTWNSIPHNQARSQDLKKGGGYFERVRKVQTTLTRIFIVLESVSHGLSENWDEISRKARKFKGFFGPKSGGLPNQKKRSSPKLRLIFRPKSDIQTFFPPKIRWSSKKKKKRSSPKLRLIFRPSSEIQTFEGGLFSYGGAIFNFSQKIGLKSTKNVRFCILHKSMRGTRAPPPLATLLRTTLKFLSFLHLNLILCGSFYI